MSGLSPAAHRGSVLDFLTLPVPGGCSCVHGVHPDEGLPDAGHGGPPDRDGSAGTGPLRSEFCSSWFRGSVLLTQALFLLQFFSWFSKLQAQMDQDEGAKYRCACVCFRLVELGSLLARL